MWFSPINSGGLGFVRRGNPLSDSPAYLPNNGTAYLQAGTGSSLMFGSINGYLFDRRSVDLAEYSSVAPVGPVHFVGYRQDGSTVTTDLTPDGIIDGTGPLV